MLDVFFSGRGNDFYREICQNVVVELNRVGRRARSRDLTEILGSGRDGSDTALLVSWGEMKQTLPGDARVQRRAARALREYEHRILLNFDSLQSTWFERQFQGDDVVTAVIDIGLLRQKTGTRVRGVPYRWFPECLSEADREHLEAWTPQRPLRWCVLAHQTHERVKLVGEIVNAFGPKGFLWLPSLRPFTASDKRSLNTSGRAAVLRKSDFYIWTSHHPWPYHEGLRAVHAIAGGSIPAKIDPVYHELFAEIPWVYRSVAALRERVERLGEAAMFEQAREYLISRGNLGENLDSALSELLGDARHALASISAANSASGGTDGI